MSAQQPPQQPPPRRLQYDAEVNKGSIHMGSLVRNLNNRAAQGWRLHTMLEQAGNTIIVYERWA